VNGMHDMGGMDGFGPIRPDGGETPFQHRWEAKAFAHLLACGALGKWNNDAVRSHFESFSPSEYLTMRYFERWNVGLIGLLIDAGLVAREEIATGRADPTAQKAAPPLREQDVPSVVAAREPYNRAVSRELIFANGTKVRARNVHPETHTRLPRYVRGKRGVIERCHGVFVFPDTNAAMLGEHPQHLYFVRFDGTELWGDRGDIRAPVYTDIWEQHLEPV
jgi:nitrile hydratase subunit beta